MKDLHGSNLRSIILKPFFGSSALSPWDPLSTYFRFLKSKLLSAVRRTFFFNVRLHTIHIHQCTVQMIGVAKLLTVKYTGI